MNITTILIILWVARLIIAFPLLTSNINANLKENRGKLPMPLKIMRLHIIFASFLQAIMTMLALSHKNNMIVMHIYVVEEFIMDMLFYRELLKKTYDYDEHPIKRNIFLVAIALFCAFAVVNMIFITDTNHFPIYTFSIQCIIMTICSIWYYHLRSFNGEEPIPTPEMDNYRIYKGPVFWMNAGKHIYFIFALPLFILYNVMMESKQESAAMLIWSIQNISLIILHIFMGIGFLVFIGNPYKVRDLMGRGRREYNARRRKKFINDPEYAERLRQNAIEFKAFMKENPDLFN